MSSISAASSRPAPVPAPASASASASPLTPSEWLLQVGRLATNLDDFLGGLCDLLVERGLPLERVGLHGRTLHPQVAGLRLLWRRGIGAEETRYGYDEIETDLYGRSPLYHVYTNGDVIRRRLTDPPAEGDFPILDELRAEGFTDYLVAPLDLG